jgi:hypothetical protein
MRDCKGFPQGGRLAEDNPGVPEFQQAVSTSHMAAYAAEAPVRPDDLAATVFDRLGIRLDQELHDAQGRPLPLCTDSPVAGLF